METINTYPYTFELSNESYQIEKSTLRKVNAQGREERTSFDGTLVGAVVFSEHDEYVITVRYDDDEYYCISKHKGWFGPFSEIENIDFDPAKGVAVVKGRKGAESGEFVLAHA